MVCTFPYHGTYMRRWQWCPACNDDGYPTAADREVDCDPGDCTAAGDAYDSGTVVALTAEQQQAAWKVWHNGAACQELMRAMAAGEIEFSDALSYAFAAGMQAAAA